MKRLPLAIIIVILVLGGYFFLLSKSSNGSATPSNTNLAYLYFWSVTCPHCKNVEAFLESWPHKNLLLIERKEISQYTENQKLLVEKSSACNIPESQVGVPLLVSPEGKCFNGDVPIIDFLKNLFPENKATISATPNL